MGYVILRYMYVNFTNMAVVVTYIHFLVHLFKKQIPDSIMCSILSTALLFHREHVWYYSVFCCLFMILTSNYDLRLYDCERSGDLKCVLNTKRISWMECFKDRHQLPFNFKKRRTGGILWSSKELNNYSKSRFSQY